jgi:hypothetical protein
MLRNFLYLGVILILLFVLYRILWVDVKKEAILRAKMNYETEVKEVCMEQNVPYNYILALIILECSGRKPAQSRFEPAVYAKLKQLRDGVISKYSTVNSSQVRNASDATLRLLATSWGALQIMGYHCYELDVPIDDLIHSETSLKVGIRWCRKNYGTYLNNGNFGDAFHFHNTGKPMPFFGITTTYDPQYVFRGMRYMSTLEALEN